jgi:hypothetical protein
MSGGATTSHLTRTTSRHMQAAPVTVERGYLPEGVWRPEDTPMCDPEAEEEEKEPEWNR